MSKFGSTVIIVLQTSLGLLLGLYYWWNLSSVYWKKDLEPPINVFWWLTISASIGVLILLSLSIISTRRIGPRSRRLVTFSALTSAFGLPLVNIAAPAVFTVLGGESSIYFISDIGLGILVTDTIFLMVIGLVIGTVIGLFATLLSRFVGLQPLP